MGGPNKQHCGLVVQKIEQANKLVDAGITVDGMFVSVLVKLYYQMSPRSSGTDFYVKNYYVTVRLFRQLKRCPPAPNRHC